MRLTFEISQNGTALDIFFDAEGRDQLIKRLSECTEPGDHYHLGFEEASVPGYIITADRPQVGGTVVEFVTVGMPVGWRQDEATEP